MSTALITGATKGIGRETARQLAALGHTVHLGARDPERGRVAAAEVGGVAVPLDVTDTASVSAALALVRVREGRLDLLVNNAGIPDDTVGVHDVDGDLAARVLDTDVAGVVRVTQAALPLLRAAEHPVIVDVGSGLGSFGEAAAVVVGAALAGPDGPTGVVLEEGGPLPW